MRILLFCKIRLEIKKSWLAFDRAAGGWCSCLFLKTYPSYHKNAIKSKKNKRKDRHPGTGAYTAATTSPRYEQRNRFPHHKIRHPGSDMGRHHSLRRPHLPCRSGHRFCHYPATNPAFYPSHPLTTWEAHSNCVPPIGTRPGSESAFRDQADQVRPGRPYLWPAA